MQTVGSWLKSARAGKGCPLREISETTKINLMFLQALEEDRFDWLPGGMFPRAMVRAYARALGASEQEAIGVYDAQFPPPPPPPEPPRRSWVPFLTVVALALVAVATAGGVLYRRAEGARPTAKSVANIGVVASPPARPSLVEPLLLEAATANPPEAFPPGLDLQILVLDECWLSLTADGAVVDQRLMLRGEAFSYHADSNFEAVVGNAGGLKFVINGEVWDNLGGPYHAKKIRIDKDDGKVRLTT